MTLIPTSDVNGDDVNLKMDTGYGVGIFSAGKLNVANTHNLSISFGKYTEGSIATLATGSIDMPSAPSGKNVKYGSLTQFDYDTLSYTIEWGTGFSENTNVILANGEITIDTDKKADNDQLIVTIVLVAIVALIFALIAVMTKKME